MGTGASKTRVAPATQVSVQPASYSEEGHGAEKEDARGRSRGGGGTSSLDSSMRTNNSGTGLSGQRTSSDSKSTTPRPVSQISRRNHSGQMRGGGRGGGGGVGGGGGYRGASGGARRFTRGSIHGQGGRPISEVSNRNPNSARRFGRHGDQGLSSAGLPLRRDIDLNASTRSQRNNPITLPMNTDYGTIVLLRTDPSASVEHPATSCQLCSHEFSLLRTPHLLLCGHSYCKACLEKATEDYPSALQCGVCSILTPLDQQSIDNLPTNEMILNLVTSREFNVMVNEKNVEKCAECIHHLATVYCSDCSASYCDSCTKRAHEGSRVRSRHKPVPVNLKPRPQPTCRKHPGQSCVLYCETEKQPMCVLCKFYNQHRFHKFDLLSKVASKYCSSVTDKLAQLDHMEQDLNTAARSLAQSVEEVNNSARKAQERLERHFSDLQKSYAASLERREAVLLTLLDHQVEVKQNMIEESRMEIAAARARILAAKEEAVQLLKLNPVSALLSRKHMDASFDQALKQTTLAQSSAQPDVPLSLLPDITPTINEALSQHGAILQLAPKMSFVDISVTTNTISLRWESSQEQSSDVMDDRTLTYSLHCHADVPFKLKAKISFKQQYLSSGKHATPESGFEDMSEFSSSEPHSNFPSVPQSLLGSRNISLVAVGRGDAHDVSNTATNQNAGSKSHVQATNQKTSGLESVSSHIDFEGKSKTKVDELEEEESGGGGERGRGGGDRGRGGERGKGGEGREGGRGGGGGGADTLPKTAPVSGKGITAMLPEPVRLPKPVPKPGSDSKLPEVVKPGMGRHIPSLLPTSVLPSSASAARLNLPPLKQVPEMHVETGNDHTSDSMSGVLADSEDARYSPAPTMKKLAPRGPEGAHEQDQITSNTGSSSTLSETSTDVSTFTNVGRFCKGFTFDEIYCGEESCFHYSGLLPGATYYFRVRCHNAAGWGPWSDTVKCTTALVNRK